jgi:hypothetical protein
MRLPLTFSAALILGLLAVAPAASALTLQTSRNPDDSSSDSSSGGANLTDPDSALPHFGSPSYLSQQSEDSGSTFHIGGGTVHFGVSGGAGGAQPGGNQWFLDSPASRTVPSQMH